MDLFFFALESPLFPGALLALFFALAARAMTMDAEVALDAPHVLRPAPRMRIPEAAPEPAPATIATVPPPATTFDFDRIAQSVADEPVDAELAEPAVCYDSHEATTDPEMPIRWL